MRAQSRLRSRDGRLIHKQLFHWQPSSLSNKQPVNIHVESSAERNTAWFPAAIFGGPLLAALSAPAPDTATAQIYQGRNASNANAHFTSSTLGQLPSGVPMAEPSGRRGSKPFPISVSLRNSPVTSPKKTRCRSSGRTFLILPTSAGPNTTGRGCGAWTLGRKRTACGRTPKAARCGLS